MIKFIKSLFSGFDGERQIFDYELAELENRFVLDYDLQSWMVIDTLYYDWGNDHITKECKIDSGAEHAYVYIDTEFEEKYYIRKEVDINSVDKDLDDYIAKHERAPGTINYDGETYYLNNEKPGYFSNKLSKRNWQELIAYNYNSSDSSDAICILQFDNFEFKAMVAKKIEKHQISNIMPHD